MVPGFRKNKHSRENIYIIYYNIFYKLYKVLNFQEQLDLKNLDFYKIKLNPLVPANPNINPQAPVALEIADEVVFRRFQGEGGEFF